ncbi:MAG TPA: sulfate adenylyltransferase subunit CysN [Steroidobacteraceae bacterium]|nr:sulfate adenylyltransferase subunit CysN [Steroidobacteraceae bacterium]
MGASADLLRFITCGSVDDGKSTLIGRLLYETDSLRADQLASLEADSKRSGRQAGEPDFALLLDGLAAEREQAITIDVAYRYFATARRRFIVADTPGHEQYTRNMVTGASTADAAVLLIDAQLGLLTQTQRHSCLVSMLGVRHVVIAVNKMDLVGWSRDAFETIAAQFRAFAGPLGFTTIACVPLSALRGDNVAARSDVAGWYEGPTLLEWLETVDVDADRSGKPFRMPVQWVNRPDSSFRGFAGTIASGVVRRGDTVVSVPSGAESRIARIVTRDGDLDAAVAGQAVTLTLASAIDVSRGDMLVHAADRPVVADQVEATIVWMHEAPMLPGRAYSVRVGTRTVTGTVSDLKCRIDVATSGQLAARTLELNDIGICTLSFDQPVAFDPYAANRDTGGMVLIDRLTHETIGAGTLRFALRRSQNVHWQFLDVDKRQRAAQKAQQPRVLWFTGLSGAGKSTIANLVERKLHALGRHTYLLDGDNVRHGLNRDLGFRDADRVENIRRVAEVARLMTDAGLIVLVSFISPFRSERRMARELFAQGEFVEIFVDTALQDAERRDPKGLYAKARRGELRNFTGIDSPYEVPEHPELRIDTATTSAEDAAELIVAWLGGTREAQ